MGRWMGLYLIVMSALLLVSVKIPLSLMVMSVMLLFFPVLLYRFLRRMYREAPTNRGFSAVWTAGIMITLCGSLICGIVTAAWMLTMQPDFFIDYLQQAIGIIEQSGREVEYAQEISMIRNAMNNGISLSPMRFVFSMMWATIFFGSVISMLIAWLLRYRSIAVLNSNNK